MNTNLERCKHILPLFDITLLRFHFTRALPPLTLNPNHHITPNIRKDLTYPELQLFPSKRTLSLSLCYHSSSAYIWICICICTPNSTLPQTLTPLQRLHH
jgi:hypothetical protein